MNEKRVWNISIQQIQIFLKAMELKNFTQTAKYFNFTLPLLSTTALD